MTRIHTRILALTLAAALPLTACTPATDTHAISVENCGQTVGFTSAPDNVTILGTEAVSTLDALNVLDRVNVKAGVFQPDYYPADLNDRLDTIPSLSDRLDASGHLLISREAVVGTNPDLVIGTSDTINRDTMKSSGIAQITEPTFCSGRTGDISFDHVYEHVNLYGTIFDKADEAAAYNQQLRDRISQLTARTSEKETRTAAVLYPTVGGGSTYAYGRASMSAPILEAAGLTNVFGDQDGRVFEVSAEELIDRDPDIIIALYSDGDEGDIVQAVTGLPGANSITAVQDQTILPLLFNFAEPPTPLAVTGLEKVINFLEETR